MARYIKANELLGKMHEAWVKLEKREIDHINVTELINEAPTADVVEVVHGEWIKADSMPRSAKCSECNCWITRHTINENWFRYCPWCGAKMDGKKVE